MPVFLAVYELEGADVTILIADGGSTDGSRAIATADRRVIWLDFDRRVPGKHGGWRNPEGAHMRFLLDAAASIRCDWLWLTEIDAIPNLALQREAAGLLADGNHAALSSWLCYVAPDGVSHYPRCMQGPGATAWRPDLVSTSVDASANADFEGQGNLQVHNDGAALVLDQRLSRIHLSWETEERVAAKCAWYEQVHGISHPHPDSSWGPRAPLPEWAVWTDPRTPTGLGGYGQPLPTHAAQVPNAST